jgi:GPH family glycoside/pentoside/hexuronide:cation symporter
VHGLAALGLTILIGLAAVWRPGGLHARNRLNIRAPGSIFRQDLASGAQPAVRSADRGVLSQWPGQRHSGDAVFSISSPTGLGLPDARGPLLFFYFLCAIAACHWPPGRPALGKHRAWCYGMLAACAAFAPAPLLPEGSLIAFAVICALTGRVARALTWFCRRPFRPMSSMSIPPPPVNNAQVSISPPGASPPSFPLPAASAWCSRLLAGFGFDPAEGAASEEGLTALAIAYAWVPIAAKLASIAIMWNFRSTKRSKSLRQRIESA